MYDALQGLLGGRVRATWAEEMQVWGTLVRLYRQYADGKQRSFLTVKQRAMLNISTDPTEQIMLNYCDMVVQAMAERLTVASIDGDTPAATTWAADLLTRNRFDGLQLDVTEASVRDGVSFVMVGMDNATKLPTFAFEPAWDGDCGLIPIYDRMQRMVVAAVKVWYEAVGKRVNLYLPDRVVKYQAADDGALGAPRSAEPWVGRDGKPLGVPVVPFANRKRMFGSSEIAPVLPMQDALNRSAIDMIMTSGLTAFQLKVALGFTPPATVAPGDWIVIGGTEGVPEGQKADAKVLEQGNLVPFISQAQFLIEQIATISRTPLPSQMGGDTQSGEALKQRETGLLGKVERYQIKGGNSWEDVMALAARVQAAYGVAAPPPPDTRWTCRWQNAEKRSDTEVIDNALKVADRVGEEEFLRLIAPVFEWNEDKIKALLAAKDARTDDALRRLTGSVPGFGGNGNGNGAGDARAATSERFGVN